LGFNSGLI